MKLIYLLFFLSGATALIYEVLWTRFLGHILGSSALSMTVVFSAFLTFLAVGAYVGGRSQVRGREALKRYAFVEFGIAVIALGCGLLLFHGRWFLISFVPSDMAFAGRLALGFLMSSLIVGLPSALMGATLPIALNGISSFGTPRSIAPWLYGWNTVGGAAGALAAGFLLIWKLGLLGALYFTSGLNCLVALVGYLIALRIGDSPDAVTDDISTASETETSLKGRDILLLSFASGFLVLGVEMLWGRIARFTLGDRTLATSYLLFVFLISLGLGSFLAATLLNRSRARAGASMAGWISCILAISAVVQTGMVLLAHTAIVGEGAPAWLPGSDLLGKRLILTFIVIAPTAIVMGTVFPALLFFSREINAAPGRVSGRLYLVNTVGAVLGAFCGAVLLSRLGGTMIAFIVFGGLQVLIATWLVIVRTQSPTHRRFMFAAGAIAVVLLAVTPRNLVWLRDGETLVAVHEDEYGVQTISLTDAEQLRVRNNRLQLIYDFPHPATVHAQQMAAHLSTLLAHAPQRVLNIGTGYGITAGTYTLYPQCEEIVSVELLPFLVDEAPRFHAENFAFYDDPRVKFMQGDGRRYLLASEQKWDVISVNVLDPYLPGSSGLYTLDFWKEARSRLNEGGVYTQLVWGRDRDMIIRGLRSVFPSIFYFPAYDDTSWNVIAFNRPISPRQAPFQFHRLTRAAREQFERVTGLPLEKWHARSARKIPRDIYTVESTAFRDQSPFHTDANPVLEFRWRHGVPGISIFDSPLIDQ